MLILYISGVEGYEEFEGEIILIDDDSQGIELNYAVKGNKSENNGHYKIIKADEDLYGKICDELGLF